MTCRRQKQLDGGLRDAVASNRRQIVTDYIRFDRRHEDRRTSEQQRRDDRNVSRWMARFDAARNAA